MATFTFDQIKLSQNENVTASVLNRALIRLYQNIDSIITTSDVSFPTTGGRYYLNVSNTTTGGSVLTWAALDDYFKEKKFDHLVNVAADITATIDTLTNDQVLVWDNNKQWVNKPYIKDIEDLNDGKLFANINKNKNIGDVITWAGDNTGWLAQSPTELLGVGYIQHEVCRKPTIVNLPPIVETLEDGTQTNNTGGQVVITKLIDNSIATVNNLKFPVLVVASKSDKIINAQSIITNNSREDFASIHLRAVHTDAGDVWIPVCATGSWRPAGDKTTILTSEYSSEISNFEPAVRNLTSQQIKLQPYNIDLSIKIGDESIAKEYEITLKKESGIWDISVINPQPQISESIDYSNGLIHIQTGKIYGMSVLKTSVFLVSGTKYSQINPDEIYFEVDNNNLDQCNAFIDINSWVATTELESLTFKVILSI